MFTSKSSSIELTSKLGKAKPFTLGNIRNGRWVVAGGKLGVVTELAPDISTVDLVDSDGFTYFTTKVPTGQIRLAKWKEIPVSRIVGLTADDAQRLGYSLGD